jgi:N-carbamoyl-L-amino-acid hydrolase
MNRREFNFVLGTATAGVALKWPLSAGSDSKSLRVNGARLNQHLKELSEFGKNPQGGVSRVAYSEADRLGREYVMGLMRAAKLNVSIDAAGNIIGHRRESSEMKLRPILVGSHIDSVPEGGNYDGDVGSLGAIEVAQTLAENSIYTQHPLEIVIFQNEEGGLIGSEAMIGVLGEKELDHVSSSGKTIRDGINFIGGDISKLASVK